MGFFITLHMNLFDLSDKPSYISYKFHFIIFGKFD